MAKLDTKYEYMVIAALVIMVTLGSFSSTIPWDTLYKFTTSFAIVALIYHLFKGDTA